MPNHVTAIHFGSPNKTPPSVATARSRASLIGTLCASPARPSHAVRQAQLFHRPSSPVQDEILGRPGGVPVDLTCRPGLPRLPDDSPRFPSDDDSWSDDRLYKDAPRSAKSDPTYLNKWLQTQCSPQKELDITKMTELCLSPAGSRRLPNSFLGDRHNLDAPPVNRNVRGYDGAVANFTLSKIKTALQAHPEHVAALPAEMDAQLSHQLPTRPSLPPRRDTYVSGGLFPMSALQTPAGDHASAPVTSLPHRFKRATLPAAMALDKRHKPEQTPPFVETSTSPSKRRPKRPRHLSSNPKLTAAALSAIAAIHGHGSPSKKPVIPLADNDDVDDDAAAAAFPHDLKCSRAVLSTGSDSSSLPSPPRLHSSALWRADSPASPLLPPATPHLLPVSSSPLPLPSSPPFLRSALRGAGAAHHPHHHVATGPGSVSAASSPRFSSPSPLAPRRRGGFGHGHGHVDTMAASTNTRFSPTRHGLSPDVVLFRGDGAARAKLRERRLGRKREGSWGDESLLLARGGRGGGGGVEGLAGMDSGEEADEEDEGDGDVEREQHVDGNGGGGRVPVQGSSGGGGGDAQSLGEGEGESVEWVFGGERRT
ncbi:hypothetical protein IWX49DRAFT_595723 [Phyllosticta citricarpa]|uniref:Uncharacterized protein n=1 Tax=Phyllosticta paracitricarpa TaxID=2016321 RepID=A0ABR1MWU5_9PEZI